MLELTPQDASTELRHIADIYVTPAAKAACLMGAEAIERGAPKQISRSEAREHITNKENPPLWVAGNGQGRWATAEELSKRPLKADCSYWTGMPTSREATT